MTNKQNLEQANALSKMFVEHARGFIGYSANTEHKIIPSAERMPGDPLMVRQHSNCMSETTFWGLAVINFSAMSVVKFARVNEAGQIVMKKDIPDADYLELANIFAAVLADPVGEKLKSVVPGALSQTPLLDTVKEKAPALAKLCL